MSLFSLYIGKQFHQKIIPCSVSKHPANRQRTVRCGTDQVRSCEPYLASLNGRNAPQSSGNFFRTIPVLNFCAARARVSFE